MSEAGVLVTVEPIGETFAVYAGETLMQAARRAGLRWPTICNGAALCGTCYLKVTQGGEDLPPPTPRELKGLKNVLPHLQGPAVRLACQLQPRSRLRVERVGVGGAARPAAGG